MPTEVDSATNVLGAEYMRSRAFVQVVRVMLQPGEQYQMNQAYRRRKRVEHQEVVHSGIEKPWDVIKSCHEFSAPMHLEQECLEILWFVEGEHPETVHVIWDQGGPFQSIASAYPFLFKKDWNISNTGLRLGDGDHIEIRLQPYVLPEAPSNNTEAQRASSRTTRHRQVPAPRPARTS